ncbi:MAG TPA: hypothetical protein VFB58_01465 [Chloroflexota bacterium]|nr:hypothetical protein [Chloroflexota bacterium]
MSDIKTDLHREEKEGRERKHATDPNHRIDPKYQQHHDQAAMDENARKEAMNPVQHPT